MPAAQIDKRFYDSPYYVFPNDNVGQEAFAVIRDAMKGKGVVALGRIVLNKRERVIALEPFGKGLLGTTLHYAYEVRDAADYFDDIADVKISGEMLKLAEHIMEGKSGEFEPSEFKDHYETALVEMLQQKQAGFKPPKGKEKPAAPNVVNLMDALRQSIAAGRRTPAAEKATPQGREGRRRRRKARSRSRASARCCCRSRARRPKRSRSRRQAGRQAAQGGVGTRPRSLIRSFPPTRESRIAVIVRSACRLTLRGDEREHDVGGCDRRVRQETTMTAPATDISVMTSGTFTAALFALAPQLERLTGKKIVARTTSVGTGETSIPNRLKRGEVADIVIVADGLLRRFIAEGLVLADGS